VLASYGGKISGILPLVIDHEDQTAKFPHHAADYNDLVAPADSGALAADLLSYATLAAHGCKRLVLSRLRPDSHCARAVSLLRDNSKIECDWRDIDTYRYINLPDDFEAYLASRSKAFRKSIRRSLKGIEREGLDMRELHPDDFDSTGLPDLLLSLMVARHKEKCSFTRSTYVQLFVRNVLPSVFLKRRMRAFAMFKGARITALDLCMAGASGVVTWNGGFLPEVERFSPGTALFAFGIQQAIASGLREFDFIRGEEGYKRSWTNSSYSVGELEIRPQCQRKSQVVLSGQS
jgi:CelD/BcsL family acetyltransferase involved in cellulose biosynthesis